jgi:hypothetical protein
MASDTRYAPCIEYGGYLIPLNVKISKDFGNFADKNTGFTR